MFSVKRIIALLLCAIMLCSFVGCKNQKDTESKPTSSQASSVDEENNDDESQEEDVDNQDDESSEDEEDFENEDTSEEDEEFEYEDTSEEDEEFEDEDIFEEDEDTSEEDEEYDEDAYHTDRYIPTVEDSTEEAYDEADEEVEAESTQWAGPKGYVIVIPKDNELASEAASTLKAWFKKNAKVDLKVVDDSSPATAKEIIIGAIGRYKYSAKEGDYFAKVEGDKLIFGGGHDVTVLKAVQVYTRLAYEEGKAYVFSGTSDFTGEKLGYTYVWGDEFETTSLDLTRWNRSTKMGATAEMTLDDTELTAKTENGYLKMFALRYWDPKKAGVEYVVPWSVTTMETMSYRYGYVEIRAKVPFIRGVWPSFWTSSSGALNNEDYIDKYGYSIEVDIFEVFSSLDQLSPNIHKWYADGRHTMWAIDQGNSNEWYRFDSDNLVNEYHTYGFEWTPTEMTMYIDDKPYYTYDLTINFDEGETGMGGFEAPIYLIFNNHLFTDSSDYKPYAGCEIHSADLPAEYFIDWVRLYQKDDGKSQLNLPK